jgi:hypothetical protein
MEVPPMKRKHQVATISLVLMTLVAASSAADKKKNAKEFEIKVTMSAKSVTITAKGASGFHCNTLYPWKLSVEGPAGQKKTYKKQEAKVFSEQKVVFEVPRSKGQKAKMKLSVCDDKQCIMHTEEFSW